MDRRGFIAAIGGALALPSGVLAQQSGRIYRAGLLLPDARTAAQPAFRSRFEQIVRERLAAQGFVEGRNLNLVVRVATWNREADIDIARALARAQPDGILVMLSTLARSVLDAKVAAPVVFSNVTDAVEEGLVKTYGRPGGNVTGTSDGLRATLGKRLELLREMLPGAKRLVLSAPNPERSVSFRANEPVVRDAAKRLGFDVLFSDSWGRSLDNQLGNAERLRPDAVFIYGQTAAWGWYHSPEIIQRFVSEARIPFSCMDEEAAELGALLSYGSDFLDSLRLSADYLARILKGAKPADLPVDQASRFKLVVNMRTAKVLGIKMPQSVLLRADRVIE